MKTATYFPEKTISTQAVGPYEVKLRSNAYWENASYVQPTYTLTVWKDWTLVDTTLWSNFEAARREFDNTKGKVAVKLAEDVLFNQGDHQ